MSGRKVLDDQDYVITRIRNIANPPLTETIANQQKPCDQNNDNTDSKSEAENKEKVEDGEDKVIEAETSPTDTKIDDDDDKGEEEKKSRKKI